MENSPRIELKCYMKVLVYTKYIQKNKNTKLSKCQKIDFKKHVCSNKIDHIVRACTDTHTHTSVTYI